MSTNKQCARYCIELIRSVMQGKPVDSMPETVSLAEMHEFARLHCVEAMVYHGLEQLEQNPEDSVWKHWSNRADMLMTQSIIQLAERDVLFAAMPAAGISILPVKGSWLKEQYPDIDYRQMSDLDILVHTQDVAKADALMRQMGYVREEESAQTNHNGYIKPPYMGVEIHWSLLPESDERYSYYEDVWKKAVASEEFSGVMRLKPEDEYIFYMTHLYKHVVYAGTGIRSFLDCVVYWKLWSHMDRAYLDAEFEKLGLKQFAQQVETLAFCWFDTGVPVPEELHAMEESVMGSAAYGTELQEFQLNMDRMYKKYKSRFVAHLVYWLYRLFAPLEEMEPQYPILGKYPWLLPVFWIVHLVQKVAREPKELLQHFKKVNKAGEKYGEGKSGWNSSSNE